MEHDILVWKYKDYFNYAVVEKYEVASVELWDWNRRMYRNLKSMYRKNEEYITMDFHGKILTVFYIEDAGEIYLPVAGSKFSNLPKISAAEIQDMVAAGAVYKLSGRLKKSFQRLIEMEPPKPRPILNNEYDFRKKIGIDIWKTKRSDRSFGLDLWDKPVIVPLGREPYL